MFFKNDRHKEMYQRLSALVPENREYDTATYVLSAIGKAQIAEYVGDGISIDAIMQNMDLSSGEVALAKIAGNLFNGRECDLQEIAKLDENNMLVVLEAIKMRYLN